MTVVNLLGYGINNHGLIIQWLNNFSGYNAITLPTSFTSTNYAVVFSGNSASFTKTTTTLTIHDYNSGVDWKPGSMLGVICIGY